MRGVESGKQEFSEIVGAMKFELDSALSPSYWRMFLGYFSSKDNKKSAKAKTLLIARCVNSYMDANFQELE